MKQLLWLALALLWVAAPVQARPISYPGGWTLMQMHDATMSSLHVHYTPTPRYSIGYKTEYWHGEDWSFQGIKINYLVQRWNSPASQANLYLKTAGGIAYSDNGAFDGKTEPAAYTGIAFDWEDRRYFFMYENRANYAGEIDTSLMQKARVGIAPYIGDYGDLHSWLMLEVDHSATRQEELIVTPLVRLFKGDYLGELGMSHRGDVMFNVMIRF